MVTTGHSDHHNISAPLFLVKVDGEKPTGFILQQRMDPQHAMPAQVCLDGICIIGQVLGRYSAFEQSAPRGAIAFGL